MDIRKLAAMGLAVLLTVVVLLPVPALATNSAGAEYPSDASTSEVSGSANVTTLTLVAQDPDANLASNGGSAWVAQRAKVQVPVAINFVVTGTGEIEGPSAAAITNYSSFPVSVSNMKVSAASGVTFAWQESGATAADQVYLEFRPSGSNTTAVNLSQFTGTNGAALPVGEWDIAAASGASGTALELVDFDGKVGGFGSLDPLSREEFATIAWTIKAGSGKVALPATLASATPADLKAAGDAIRGGDADVKSHYDALVGDTMTIHYGDQYAQTATVRLVDVSVERGLTFMFTSPLAHGVAINDSSNDSDANWENSRVRRYLNGENVSDLGSSPLNGGFKLDIAEQSPTYPRVTTVNSLDCHGKNREFTLNTVACEWWIPSVVEIFGSGAWPSGGAYKGNEGCAQFAYFASNTVDRVKEISNQYWWLRSNCSYRNDDSQKNEFAVVYGNEGVFAFPTPRQYDVVPCFCL